MKSNIRTLRRFFSSSYAHRMKEYLHKLKYNFKKGSVENEIVPIDLCGCMRVSVYWVEVITISYGFNWFTVYMNSGIS